MSESDDEPKPESSEDTEPRPKPAPAFTPTLMSSKSSESSGGLFDSDWDSILGKSGSPSFAPPSVAGAEPAQAPIASSFASPGTTPRTSDASASVSGEFGVSGSEGSGERSAGAGKGDVSRESEERASEDEVGASEAEAGASKDEAGASKDEVSASEDEAGASEDEAGASEDEVGASEDGSGEDSEDEAGSRSPEQLEDDAKDGSSKDGGSSKRPKEIAKTLTAGARLDQPSDGGSSKLLWILGLAAAIVIAVVYGTSTSNGDEAGDAQASASKPNGPASPPAKKEAKGADRPHSRPPQVKTHAADPVVAAMRERAEQADGADTDGATGEGEAGESGDATGVEGDDAERDGAEVELPTPAPKVENPRDPSLIPPGTSEESAKAFSKLPVSLNDGPPIGGIGRDGTHADAIAMAGGRDNNGCDDPTRSFSVAGTEFINVCFRVVHPRSQATLRVIWEKDGTVTRRGKVRIPESLHAYKTRAYLRVRPEYVGSWRVRIAPEGEEDTDLAVAEFEIGQ